jgi:hydroxymethylglutaryl-CoA lyase
MNVSVDSSILAVPSESAPQVLLCEVGMRDGLQAVSRTMATTEKIEWLKALYSAGLREIEVASFVPPKLLPQMADADAVVRHATSLPDLCVVALVPNARGAQAAIAAGAHKIVIPCSASAAHSLANVRKSREDMIEEVRTIVAIRNETAPQVRIEAGISTAFGCTIQGEVREDDVIWLADAVMAAGADETGLADTTGMANPKQVSRLFKRLMAAVGVIKIAAAHMHNTRGLGLANCLAAYEVGVRGFDSSQAGLGGCPYAPGASGNVATEDLVFMFEAMGVRTGVDVEKMMAGRAVLQRALPGEPLHGMVAAAGLPKGFSYAR